MIYNFTMTQSVEHSSGLRKFAREWVDDHSTEAGGKTYTE